MDLVLGHIDRAVNHLSSENPMPVGETRIDPRTARKRLQLVPHADLYDHLGAHG